MGRNFVITIAPLPKGLASLLSATPPPQYFPNQIHSNSIKKFIMNIIDPNSGDIEIQKHFSISSTASRKYRVYWTQLYIFSKWLINSLKLELAVLLIEIPKLKMHLIIHHGGRTFWHWYLWNVWKCLLIIHHGWRKFDIYSSEMAENAF